MTAPRRLTAALAAIVLSAAPALGQYPQGATGFAITTNLGQTAGSFCWWFTCTPATLTVTAGEVLTLRISGEWTAPYVLGGSNTATSCVAYPGIFHNLVIDLPVTILASGTLASVSPVLACPNGYTLLTSQIPPGFPTGTTIAVQALTNGAGNVPAFTGAILVTIM
jgi:hypothetical protein